MGDAIGGSGRPVSELSPTCVTVWSLSWERLWEERGGGEDRGKRGPQDMVQAHTLAVIGAGMIGSSAARWAAAELGICQWDETFESGNGMILWKLQSWNTLWVGSTYGWPFLVSFSHLFKHWSFYWTQANLLLYYNSFLSPIEIQCIESHFISHWQPVKDFKQGPTSTEGREGQDGVGETFLIIPNPWSLPVVTVTDN